MSLERLGLRALAITLLVSPAFGLIDPLLDPDSVCSRIVASISSASVVYSPLDLLGQYNKDISHWASSSTEAAACSVEPGTAQDVGTILTILGETRTPYAVKGGGHTTNPGFSSTEGIHIALFRFSEVNYDASAQTVDVGAGLVWDDVYNTITPQGANVVGGRVSGVGVAGFTLGGGYSWKTNQHGLTVDTVLAFELVKPDGSVVTVTDSSDSDLFFALKGGFNNFGIVTKFTFKTHPQTQVWGGLRTYTLAQVDDVVSATHKFASEVTDPKAGIITTFNFLLGQIGVSELLFYDAPSAPSGIFDDFLAIPALTSDVSTRDFPDLITSPPANVTAGQRGVFQTVPLAEYTPTILAAIVNETNYWGATLSLKSGSFISYQVEPFVSSFLTHGSASAYPPSRAKAYSPFNIFYVWSNPLFDDDFYEAIKQSADHLRQVAINEGQDVGDAPLYPNYAIFDTPLERMYGENVERLRETKERIDPSNVTGLSGGFKF